MVMPSIEYQAKCDDAWYVVSVQIVGCELRVHYEDFGDDCEFDEMLSMEEFQSSISRFRLACRQLQDQHCDQVKEGLHICASSTTSQDEIKYFDAIVKQVYRSKHGWIDDEEHCTCTFKVLWQAGPNACRITFVSCKNICLLTTGSIESHSIMKEFVMAVRNKLARQEQELSLDLNSMPVELKTELLHIPTSSGIRNEGSKHSEDYSRMKRPPPSSALDNWEDGYTFERVSEQPTMEENQKDKEIIDHNVGKKVLFHYSGGSIKQRTLRSNEIFNGGRQGQDCSQTNANVKASKKLVQHDDDLDGVDTLSSSYLTTSHVKHNRSHSAMEPFASSASLQGFSDQNLGNVEKIVKDVLECKQPVEQLLNIEVPPQKIPSEVLGISSDKSSRVFEMQSNSSNDIDAPRSGGLTTSDVKVNIRNNYYGAFKDSSDHSDQTGNTVHIVKGVNKHNELKSKKIRSPELLSEVVNISSDEEDDHGTSTMKCDYGSQDLSRQYDNHVKLQRELSTVEEIKVDHTSMFECHRNVQGRNEDRTIIRCNYEGQKSVSAIQHNCNGHSVSEKSDCYPSFDSDHDLGRNFHLISKECQKMSPNCSQVYSKPSESSIRQTMSPACNQCRTFSVDNFTSCCKYSLQSSMCRCSKLHISDDSVLLQDESISDGEGTGHSKVSNCKHHRKSMISMLSSRRENMRNQRGVHEDRCGCIDAGCGHCNEDVRTEERQFYSSKVLVLDNLEKDVSPFDVRDVISSMGCSVLHVFILPTLKLEQFTRGFVWFRDRASLMKALRCLQDEIFFVISSNGRPWVVLHIDDGLLEGIFEGFNIDSKYCKQCTSSKISFVYKEDEDFEKAKKRKNCFLEFKERLSLLHKRLKFEEKMLNES